MRIYILLYLITGVILSSCNGEKTCSNTVPSPSLIIRFFTINIDPETLEPDTIPYRLPYLLTVTGIGRSEPLIEDVTNIQEIGLPLDITRNQCGYNMIFTDIVEPEIPTPHNSYNEVLLAEYELQREFLSPECGFYYNFINLKLTVTNNEKIKNSVQVQNSIYFNDKSPALYLYF